VFRRALNVLNDSRECYDRGSDVKFEVFTAVTMKNCVFWVVTPCGSCKNQKTPTILRGSDGLKYGPKSRLQAQI
jgi:hypothetical protein